MFGIAGSLIGDVWSRNPENLHMELAFLSSIQSTDLEDPAFEVIGARELDMSVLPDGTRRVYLVATLQSALAGRIAYVELWDVTHGVLVTNASISNGDADDETLAETVTSLQLEEGTTDGTIRTDAPAEYELRLFRTGGDPGDLVSCLNAYIRVVFE